jgi:haloalkane dehalogenase
VHLVIQDWGSALGFKLARLNSSKIKSITFMEAIVRPMTWDEWPDAGTKIFKLFRSDAGEEIVLEKNFFVERLLLGEGQLSEQDQEEYRRPFLNAGEDRRPTLTWPRNIPLDGEPAETTHEVQLNADFHKNSDIPKLFINAEPGFLLVGAQREFARSWNNLSEVTVKGNHFVQESSPHEISKSISSFVKELD